MSQGLAVALYLFVGAVADNDSFGADDASTAEHSILYAVLEPGDITDVAPEDDAGSRGRTASVFSRKPSVEASQLKAQSAPSLVIRRITLAHRH